VDNRNKFVIDHAAQLSPLLLSGIDGWSSESKARYLRGFGQFISLAGSDPSSLSPFLPAYFSSLGVQVRDDESEVRNAAELCCFRIGSQAAISDVLDILLPRVAGEVPGGDTSGQRTSGLRVLTHCLRGFPIVINKASNREEEDGEMKSDDLVSDNLVSRIASVLSNTNLYEFREAVHREAVLLLVRELFGNFKSECLQSIETQKQLTLSLLYLSGKCPGEDDVVSDVSFKELIILSSQVYRDMSLDLSLSALLKSHFEYIFCSIVKPNNPELFRKGDYSQYLTINPKWESKSPSKAAFEKLLYHCPSESWAQHAFVIPIFKNQVQPPKQPVTGSAEANALSYAAQRGDEIIPTTVNEHVDVRLSLLALLEGFIRLGAANWECGQHIADSAELIIKEIVVPNLIWRIGRVEGTVRKVALATSYAILKAGALRHETLFKSATDLVPLIVSNLDDMESTPRHISCLCLTVLFERLKGAFSEESIREIYPKLIARLDDSSDSIRIAICGALISFLQCGHRSSYNSTMVDYILDQLFIHMDDPDPAIQEAVFQVAVTVASSLNKQLVLKKAELNRLSHRTPIMCNKLIIEVQGFEILED
jgi:dynein assembly factor 5